MTDRDLRPDKSGPRPEDEQRPRKETTTLNLDTGEVEPLPEPKEEDTVFNWATGSDGGSAADGGAA